MAHGSGCPAEGRPAQPMTVAEFEALPEEDAYRLELVRGLVVREPLPRAPHARVQVRLAYFLEAYAEKTGAGIVLAEFGYVLEEDPPTVRGPDLSYVSRARIPAVGYADSFWRLGPDLAIEILSPSNRPAEIRRKAQEYLAAGSRLVWVIDPRRKTITIHDAASAPTTVGPEGTVEGGVVLPGFTLPLPRLFMP